MNVMSVHRSLLPDKYVEITISRNLRANIYPILLLLSFREGEEYQNRATSQLTGNLNLTTPSPVFGTNTIRPNLRPSSSISGNMKLDSVTDGPYGNASVNMIRFCFISLYRLIKETAFPIFFPRLLHPLLISFLCPGIHLPRIPFPCTPPVNSISGRTLILIPLIISTHQHLYLLRSRRGGCPSAARQAQSSAGDQKSHQGNGKYTLPF